MNLILIIGFLALFIYNETRKSKASIQTSKSFFSGKVKWMILVGIIVVPTSIFYFSFSGTNNLDREKELNLILENLDYQDVRGAAFEELMDMYPDSLELRLKYIDYLEDYRNLSCSSVLDKTFSSNDKINEQARTYAMLTHWDNVSNNCNFHLVDWSIKADDSPYQHYLMGYRDLILGERDLAIQHFEDEIEINPNNIRNKELLLELKLGSTEDELKTYIEDRNNLAGLSNQYKRIVYMQAGDWSNYFNYLVIRPFDYLDYFAIFAALVISIVWLLFLRGMDVFNPEKWRDMIIVFIAGSFFSNFCLFIYDIVDLNGFRVGTSAWGDLVYCIAVIGFSEELVKLIPWVVFAFVFRKNKEPYDLILYASISSLGFAFVENWMYLEDPYNIAIRSIMSSVGHMFFGSLVAIGFIFGKHRAKKLKWIYPLIGFVLACLAHGFYDVWLISPYLKGLGFITSIFFILSFHIWLYFINNSMNLSSYFKSGVFDMSKQANILIFGLVGVLVIEFCLLAMKYRGEVALEWTHKKLYIVVIFLMYAYLLLQQFKLKRGRWLRYKLPIIGELREIHGYFNPAMKNKVDYYGLKLRLFVPKSNRFVANQFPITGVCTRTISIDGVSDWYIFESNQLVRYNNFMESRFIIRAEDRTDNLKDDKVEIIFLMIPKGMDLFRESYNSKEFGYIGKVFTRPI